VNQLVKERLTGAIILVALIVLLVPELLTGPVRPGSPSVASNSAEEPPLRSYTISLSDDARARAQAGASGPEMPQPGNQEHAAPTTQSSGAPPPGALTPPPVSASPQTTPAAAASGHSAATTAPTQKAIAHPPKQQHASASPTHSSPSGGGWMVQLGVFASRENAEHLAQEMKGKGFRASVSEAAGSSRHLYRVRIGPAPDRAAAQDLQGRLRASGHSGTLVPFS